MNSLTEIIEGQAAIIRRQAYTIARLSLALLQYIEQEDLDRILQEEEE